MSEQAEPLDALDEVYRHWLAARRLENQKTSLFLHSLIRKHAVRIRHSEDLIEATRGLVSAAASLWRAVCLSDRLAVYDDFEEDDFILTDRIIRDDHVAGPSDLSGRPASDRSFLFHMSRARDALKTIAVTPEMQLLSLADVPSWIGLSYKTCWMLHQSLLDRAVKRFEKILGG